MFRVAIQVKDLISSNVTSALENASDPAKMMRQIQREIEEAIINLEGERGRLNQHKRRLETSLMQSEMREADWGDKAKTAMDHDREDLARQALLAREDCREAITGLKNDIARADADLTEIDAAVKELEAKREDARQQAKMQTAADASACGSSGGASKAERHLDRISKLEKRTEFAAEDSAICRGKANVENEIADIRRASAVDAELEAMKTRSKVSSKRPRKKAK